jgi:hypothetical protein
VPTQDNGRPYATNDIIHRNIVVYGAQGHGKSEFIRAFAEKLIEKYGESQAITILSRNFPTLISAVGSVKVPVQCYVWEDASLKKQKDEELSAFFNVRHIYAARTGIYKGVIITANVTHDLFAIKKKMRSSVDGIFFRSLPDDDYDRRIAKDILGEDVYNKFAVMVKERDKNPQLMGYTAYNIKGERGFVCWDLAKQNYVLDVDTALPIKTSNSTSSVMKVIGIMLIVAMVWVIIAYVLVYGVP